jgi:hypothetical protein
MAQNKQAKEAKIAQAMTIQGVAAPAQDAADKILPEGRQLVRANKVTITTLMETSETEVWIAVFHRTHALVAKIDSRTTKFQPTAEMTTSTARREGYRQFITAHAVEYGVFYDPTDRRAEINKMPSRYDTDDLLMETAAWLVRSDVEGWCDKIANRLGTPVEIVDVVGESIDPMTVYKERMVNARYTNGCWAYAVVSVVMTVMIHDEESYVTFRCNLVSGQLSKPKVIGDAGYGYNYQGLVSEIARDVAEVANAQ